MKPAWLGLMMTAFLLLPGFGRSIRADENFQAHFLYTGTNPDDIEGDWSDNTQGLAHDDTHWYISQKGRLWRVPVTVDLRLLTQTTPGVQHVLLADIPQLASEGYNHMGDLVFYECAGQGFLFVPMEDTFFGKCGVAVFHADSLAYIDHITLYPDPNSHQSHWAWVAIDPAGNLYGSNFDAVDRLFRYTVDWPALIQSNQLLISNATSVEVPLFDENGNAVSIDAVQGGEFAPGGTMFYLINGFTVPPVQGRIHAFKAPEFRRVAQSCNGCGPFNFETSPGAPYFDEPEGVTIWDLEGTGSPQRGKMHVIVVNNDIHDVDEVKIKHYTNVIMVDGNNAGSESGTPELPFHTVTGAADLAWDGAEIRVRANTYPETLAISKHVRMTAEGGTARIGG